jgi:hypothetical protein
VIVAFTRARAIAFLSETCRCVCRRLILLLELVEMNLINLGFPVIVYFCLAHYREVFESSVLPAYDDC